MARARRKFLDPGGQGAGVAVAADDGVRDDGHVGGVLGFAGKRWMPRTWTCRSSDRIRDWAAACTEAPREVCELALAHVNNDRTEAAYRRSDLFERRRTLMQQWADYLAATA